MSRRNLVALKIAGLAGLLTLAGLASWALPAPTADKPAIPPDLAYEFKPVPMNDNAIINWRQAADLEVSANDRQKQVMRYCWTVDAHEPATEDLDSLRAWLKQNREALALFDTSLKKPKAQWPERDPQKRQPEIGAFAWLIRARLLQADLQAQQKQFTAAVQLLDDNLKLAQRAAQGDAQFIHYLLACSARSLTQEAMLRLACRKELSVSLLENLLTNLPSLDTETNLYDRVVRVEFSHDYEHSLDIKKLADDWSKMSGTNAALVAALYPEDLQRAFRVLLDPSLVVMHPKPYDGGAEIEKSIKVFRTYRSNTLVPWTERDGGVELDHETDRTNLVQDIAPLMELLKDDPLPLSKRSAEKARAAYLAIENPIGRMMDASVIDFAASDFKVCQVRTEREVTRAYLAAMIFERRKGRLPATLDDMVKEKILPCVPMDPFNGEPLHYSRERRILWSVGEDGVDDNGESGRGRWYEKDAVWHISEVK